MRHSLFQATAILTTTGFATADYALWGPIATVTLLLLMFSGASAGSTGGGIKIVRHLLLFKLVRRELEQTVHREAIVPIRANGRVVDEKALRSLIVFVLLYLLVFAIGSLGLVIDSGRAGEGLTAFEAFGAAAACLGNVGPAFGFAGPYGSFAPFSDLSTLDLHGIDVAGSRRDHPRGGHPDPRILAFLGEVHELRHHRTGRLRQRRIQAGERGVASPSSTTASCTGTACSRACGCSMAGCSAPSCTWSGSPARRARSGSRCRSRPTRSSRSSARSCAAPSCRTRTCARSSRAASAARASTRGCARCRSLIVSAYPFPPFLGADPIKLFTSAIVRKAPRSLGAHVKSLNYLDAIVAKQQAGELGVHDAVMLDSLGAVAECTGANLFIVVGDR